MSEFFAYFSMLAPIVFTSPAPRFAPSSLISTSSTCAAMSLAEFVRQAQESTRRSLERDAGAQAAPTS
jgi:hypothetical protein